MANKTREIKITTGPNFAAERFVELPAGDYAQQVAILMIDEAGDAYAVKHIGNKLRVSSMPYLYDIAEGNVSGHEGWELFGYNGDIGTTEEDLWTAGAKYVWPLAEQQMEVVSTSGDDDGDPAGTGVQTVTIHYLDDDLIERSTTVTLDGTTAVDTAVSDIYRVQSLHTATVGTGGKAAGVISLRNTAGSVVYAQIAAGYTANRGGYYTVPAGKTLFLTTAVLAGFGTAAGVGGFGSIYDSTPAKWREIGRLPVFANGGTAYAASFNPPLEVPAGYTVRITSGIASCWAYLTIHGWVE